MVVHLAGSMPPYRAGHEPQVVLVVVPDDDAVIRVVVMEGHIGPSHINASRHHFGIRCRNLERQMLFENWLSRMYVST